MYHVKCLVKAYATKTEESFKTENDLKVYLLNHPEIDYLKVRSGVYRIFNGRKRMNLTSVQRMMGWSRPRMTREQEDAAIDNLLAHPDIGANDNAV